MTYGQLRETCINKFKAYDASMCAHALKDCHATLALHRDLPTDDPYYVKLWAEIDALRERQLKLKPFTV